MSIEDDVRVLREALAAKPAPGPWEFYPGGRHARGSIAAPGGHLCVLSTRRASSSAERSIEQMRIDGAYLTACTPERVQSVLDALEIESRRGITFLGGTDGASGERMQPINREK